MRNQMQKLCQYRKQLNLSGFSLLEVAFVILIVGILSAAAMKGYDVLQSARITASAQELQRLQLAWTQYRERMGRSPGDPPWGDLYAAHALQSDQPPTLKMGGVVRVVRDGADMPGAWLVCEGSGGSPLLTPAQAQQLKNSMDEGALPPSKGRVRLMGDGCVSGDQLKATREVGCTVYVELGP
jgi:prepilin-type N-terminal cleavage/methylation domain-containing protein